MIYTNVTSNKIQYEQICPTSKSYANRALILAALKKESVKLYDIPQAKDVEDLIDILRVIGVQITQRQDYILVENSFPDCEVLQNDPVLLPGSEGGTTIRFVVALLALGKNSYQIPLLGNLSKRPFKELIDLFQTLNVVAKHEDSNLFIKGPLIAKEQQKIKVDCSKTTQFASAFLLLNLKLNFDVTFENVEGSQSYLKMSEYLLNYFRNENEYQIPADFSSLGYFIAYGVLAQDLLIKNVIDVDYLQADSAMFEILDQIEAKYKVSHEGLEIFKSPLSKGFEIDGAKCIDLVPTLMFLASFLPAKSKIKNIHNLRYKESDRLTEMLRLLNLFDVKYDYNLEDDLLTITGDLNRKRNFPTNVVTEEDHRMVMVATLFIKILGGGKVAQISCTSKSFLNFPIIFV